MSEEREMLNWIEEQEYGYLDHSEVLERFPDADYSLVGVTGKFGDDGGPRYPARDYRRALLRTIHNE